jgi:DNA-binding MarR family transcriptional regulator
MKATDTNLSRESMKDTQIANEIMALFKVVTSAMVKGYRSEGIDLPTIQLVLLKMISKTKNCKASDINATLGKDKAQITRSVSELINKGLVKRKQDVEDRRAYFLVLTEEGGRIVSKLDPVEESTIVAMTKGLSKNEIKEFRKVSQVMIDNLLGTTKDT